MRDGKSKILRNHYETAISNTKEMEKPNIVEISLLLSIWNALNTRFFGDRYESPAQHMVTLQAKVDLKWKTLQFWIKVKVKTSSEKSQKRKSDVNAEGWKCLNAI